MSARSPHASEGFSVVDPNRALFAAVIRLLVPVLDELVFVGGCSTGMRVTAQNIDEALLVHAEGTAGTMPKPCAPDRGVKREL